MVKLVSRDWNWPFGCGGVKCTLQLQSEPGSGRFHPMQAHPCLLSSKGLSTHGSGGIVRQRLVRFVAGGSREHTAHAAMPHLLEPFAKVESLFALAEGDTPYSRYCCCINSTSRVTGSDLHALMNDERTVALHGLLGFSQQGLFSGDRNGYQPLPGLLSQWNPLALPYFHLSLT